MNNPSPNLLLFPTPPAISDAAAREEALDIQRSFLIEAPAGSGKTGLLIRRYLKLLTDPAVTDPAQVLAITFTLKATAEMRERVLGQLTDARDAIPPKNAFDRDTRPLAEAVVARDREAGWNLIESPQRFNIRTIDAVCAQIARSLPILSGSAGSATPVEPATGLYQQAARRTLMQLGGPDAALNAALETLLLHRDGNLSNCEQLLANMLSWRDQWGELVPLTRRDLDEQYLDTVVLPKLERALEQVVCRTLTRIAQVIPQDLLAELTLLASRLAWAEGYKGAESPITICRELTSAPGQAAADLAHWRSLVHLVITPSQQNWRGGFNKNQILFETTPKDRADLKELVARFSNTPGLVEILCSLLALPPLQYPADQWRITKALFQILSRALVELQLVFAERNECDFTEISLLAKSALRREDAQDDLSTALGMRLQHLLVDEMQDTSTGQYELIQLLTQNWDGRSQTVFLVGDPKQSIYLFRQARVERFVHTLLERRLGDIPLTPLQLTANFRSQRTLVTAFNETFARLFPLKPDPTQPEQVPYVAASAVREATGDAAFAWHASLTDDSTQPGQNASEIASIAAAWRSRNPGTSIAVLVRNKRHLHEIIDALKLARLPFRAVEIEPLADRQEILDLTALTRALLHPADRTAWFALLRSPACGLTLADLHQLAGADDHAFAEETVFHLIEIRGEELSEDGIERISRVYPILRAALARRGRLPLAELIERTWHSLGMADCSDEEASRNANRFFSLLDQLEEPGGRLELTTLTDRLARLFAEPSVHPGAIDLMTIHKAKGLEWDVVFVPALEKIGRSSTGRLLSWLEIESTDDSEEEDQAPGILAPIPGKGRQTDGLTTWIQGVEKSREAAERKRLFYVACTRAREELHLFASPKAKKDGAASVPSTSLLGAAWPAAEPHFLNAAAPAEPDVVFKIAAEAEPESSPKLSRALPLQRVPANYLPQQPAPLFTPARPQRLAPIFTRSEGSFAARTYGNAVHALLEQITAQLASGTTSADLLAELPRWTPRAAAILRASGLPPALVESHSARAIDALTAALRDPEGLWLLGPHPAAATEHEQVSLRDGAPHTLRADRVFLAGPTPLSEGESHLWIVDYKTANVEDLEVERQRHAQQLEGYADELAAPGQPLRLALYFPSLPQLIWWEAPVLPDGPAARGAVTS
ncbi:AAA family ATPase [Granulicella sp. WH15]|uniref:UvrD-helicase domain-containing protein n=1 Tax=Granulicella sp. WH15 TaxID=2602070 RepID=UPI001366A412|nr:UvrD-helicase domain-containing protein [Granulicella sp. WH15]QHN04219.1 AAA family ATPase [Granulicella sp. WH15]